MEWDALFANDADDDDDDDDDDNDVQEGWGERKNDISNEMMLSSTLSHQSQMEWGLKGI